MFQKFSIMSPYNAPCIVIDFWHQLFHVRLFGLFGKICLPSILLLSLKQLYLWIKLLWPFKPQQPSLYGSVYGGYEMSSSDEEVDTRFTAPDWVGSGYGAAPGGYGGASARVPFPSTTFTPIFIKKAGESGCHFLPVTRNLLVDVLIIP